MAPFYENYLEWNEKKNKNKLCLFSSIQYSIRIQFKRNFILFNREIFNNSKLNTFRVTFTQQYRIINQHSHPFNEKAQNSKTKLDQRNIITLSQACVS
jgi:hypothetical protein